MLPGTKFVRYMANEFKITDLVDKSALTQLEDLRGQFDKTKKSYANMAKILAGGIKINPKTLQELSDKAVNYNQNLTNLITTQNKLSDLQEKQVKILSLLKNRFTELTSLSALPRLFDELATNVTKASKALEVISSSTDKVSSSQNSGAVSAQKYSQSMEAASQSLSLSKNVYSDIILNVMSYDKKAGELNKRLTENKLRIDELKKQLAILNKEFQRGALSRQAYIEKSSKLISNERALVEENKQYTMLLRDHSKVMISTAGSYDEMNAAVAQLERRLKSIGRVERESESGQKLFKQYSALKDELISIDAKMKNYQRNVGNYKSHWDGLGMSIQQVARELPSLAVGWNTFFLAISNNLPILADEIKRARTEFNALTAAGQKATPVWKQVISSIFSWQTLLVAGITILSMYGKDLMDWVSSLFKAKSAVIDLMSAEQQMALARKNAMESSIRERSELDLLYKKLKDTTITTKERTSAVNEWIKKYPQHSNIMNGELVDLNNLNAAYKSLSSNILESAKARAYMDVITENNKKILDLEKKRLYQIYVISKAEEEYNSILEDRKKNNINAEIDSSVLAAAYNLKKQKDAYNEIVELQDVYAKNSENIAKKIKLDDLFPQPKEGTKAYWENIKNSAISALDQIDSKQRALLKKGITTGIDKSIVDIYNDSMSKIKQADKELAAYNIISNKQIEKEEESHAKYMLRIDNNLAKARASVIDQERNSEIESIKAKYQEKASIIKGDTDKEKALRIAYEEAMKKEIAAVNEKYDREIEKANLQNKLEGIRGNSEEELSYRLNLQLEINELLRKAEIAAARDRGEDIEAINKKYDKRSVDIVYNNALEIIGLRQKSNDREIDILDINSKNKIAILNKEYQSGKKTTKQYQEELLQITKDAGKARLDILIKETEEALKLSSSLPEEKVEELKIRLAQLKQELDDFFSDSAKKDRDFEMSGFNKGLANMKDVSKEYLGDVSDIFDAFYTVLEDMSKSYVENGSFDAFWEQLDVAGKASYILQGYASLFNGISAIMDEAIDARIEKIEEEQEANEEAGEQEINRIERLAEIGAITKEESEARKRESEKRTKEKNDQLEKQKEALQEKQAKWQKANAITQAAISTAVGIMQTIATVGFPIAIPLIAAIGILGAAQIATIAAQPIPKYAKGTSNHPGGMAIVGDGGKHEAILTDDGAYVTPAVPTLVEIPKRAVVVPDILNMDSFRYMRSDLGVLMKDADRRGEPVTVNVNNDYSRLEKKTDSLIAETRNVAKYMKELSKNAEWSRIASRL